MSAIANLKSKLQELYLSKSESEQKMLRTLAVFFSVFLLYSLYTTVSDGLSQAQSKLKRQTELNVWANEQIAVIKAAGRTSGASNRSGSMTQVINSSARKYNVNISRLQPQKSDMVKVGIDEIGFNRLMQWLAELNSRHGISATNIDFSSTDVSGVVKIRRLDLERG